MHSELKKLALNLVRGAFLELYLTPKPGLVDQYDSGSHSDLSLSTMEESLKIVTRYLLELSEAVGNGGDFAAQVRIGNAAERAMLKQLGTNSHKGYIFLSGLLLSASSQATSQDESALRQAVTTLAIEFFNRDESWASNGSKARNRFGAGGVRTEALNGLPSLFGEALPAFRQEILSGGNRGSAVYAMLGRLMATVEDTTSLHRCGSEGLKTVREDGRMLERLVADREDFISFLSERNDHYVSKNLTMGGVADLLALAFAWLSHTGELEGVSQA